MSNIQLTTTLPQDVSINGNPQFNKLGIGGPASSDNIVGIKHTSSGPGGKAAVIVSGVLNPPSGVDLHPNAYRDATTYISAINADAYASYDCKSIVSGNLPYNHIVGFQSRPSYYGLSQLDLLANFSAQSATASTGSIQTHIGFYAQDPLGTGVITSNFGLYVGDLIRGTNNYSIYTAGTAPIALGGPIFIDLSGAYGSIAGAPGALNNANTSFRSISKGSNGIGSNIVEIVNWAAPNVFAGRRAGGSRAVAAALSNDDAITSMAAYGHNGNGFLTAVSANYNLRADGAWSVSNNGCYHQWNGTPSGSTSIGVWMMLKGGQLRLNTYGAGTLITDSSGNITVSSDGSLKNIIGNFNRGLYDILQLEPKIYNWKENSGLNPEDKNVGFIAQEVLNIIPEAVGKTEKGLLTLSDRPIIATLVNAIKELKQEINMLNDRIKKLENK